MAVTFCYHPFQLYQCYSSVKTRKQTISHDTDRLSAFEPTVQFTS